MKPNFVLDFSHSGIRLLHRTAGGWTRVGDVSFEDADMDKSIGFLRQTALAMEPHGLATKLVIPTSQILFKTIDITPPADTDIAPQIAAALEGLTPYAVTDLVFDWRRSGQTVQVAAVAKETLAEAEGFATRYKMNPVSFVAIPDVGTFDGEPYFGMAKAYRDKADAIPIEPDNSTIVVLGLAKDEPPSKSAPVAGETPKPDDVESASQKTSATQAAPAPNVAPPPVQPRPASAPVPPASPPKEAPQVSGIADGVLASTAAASLTPDASFKDAQKSGYKPVKPAQPAKPGLLARKMSGDKTAPKDPVVAPTTSSKSEKTVFGARKRASGKGAKRRLGLILAFVVILAIAAFLASLVAKNGLSSLFGSASTPTTIDAAAIETLPDEALADAQDLATIDPLPDNTPGTGVDLPDIDSEELLPEPEPEALDETPAPMTLQEARAAYAANGIWQLAPEHGPLPPETTLDDLYVASIDPMIASQDAIALPPISTTADDIRPATPASPPAVGTVFKLNDNGNVTPSVDGTLTPDGILVFAGRPAKTPATRVTPEVAPVEPQSRIAVLRPKTRPDGLVEQNEKVQLGGRLRTELAGLKPQARPKSAQQAAEQDLADAVANDVAAAVANNPPPAIVGSRLAVATSRIPSGRPSNIASLADRARKQTAALAPASVAPDKTPSSEETAVEPELASVAPRIPSSASVTRQATVTKALKLSKVNLIGIYGTPTQRRALVRLPNGKFVKLKIGDSVDGGKVAAIGPTELSYVKRGRNVILTMPKG